MHTVECRLVIGPEIRLFCRRIHAHFSPKMSQDAAVKGLKKKKEKEKRKRKKEEAIIGHPTGLQYHKNYGALRQKFKKKKKIMLKQ